MLTLPPGLRLHTTYQWIGVPDKPILVGAFDRSRLVTIIGNDKSTGNYIAVARTASGFPDGNAASVDGYGEQVLYGPEEIWIRAGNLNAGTEYLGHIHQVFVA